MSLKRIFLIVLLVGLTYQVALAQSSSIPAFPDDDAELVDPDLLDLTKTTPPAQTPPAPQTVTVKDSGTGTPTWPVVGLSVVGALATIGFLTILKRSKR